MTQYKNTPEGFVILRKRILKRSIPIVFISALAGLIIFYFSSDGQSAGILIWVLTIVFIIGIMTYSISKAIKRQKEIYDSYLLEINDEQLSRYQDGLPNTTLTFNEIADITEDKNGDLLIKGQNKQSHIGISTFIQNYAEIKDQLQSKRSINQNQTKNILQKYPLLAGLLPGILMIAVYISNNKTIVSVSGTALIILMIWGFYDIRTSKLLDSKVKRNSWFILIVLAAIIAIVYRKVFAS